MVEDPKSLPQHPPNRQPMLLQAETGQVPRAHVGGGEAVAENFSNRAHASPLPKVTREKGEGLQSKRNETPKYLKTSDNENISKSSVPINPP